VTELSRYRFEVLRKDDAFVLYRGQDREDASRVLVLSPAVERPSPEIFSDWSTNIHLGKRSIPNGPSGRSLSSGTRIARCWC
jgi:hypothetical protein